ncbi:ABC transporter permease [Actinoplanes oblitus]|uniref:ABC transporter permease n=1 Tax=Actinoplanes oblitus TaxID=3040509 RepID=A0ABY8WUY2_9ACTN|nr:ABC transporter permease [Actinoplanes oblitus]WIM99750.1 ABC transporter permease [Actinoplanes oblitus]
MSAYLRVELTRMFRDGGYLMLSLVLPVAVYLLLHRTAGTGGDHAGAVARVVSAAAFGALGVAVNSCTSIAEDRARGWLRQLRLTPLSPVQVVLGRAGCTLAVVILPVVAVGVAGATAGGVTLAPGAWLGTALVLWFAVTPIALLGLALGYLVRPAVAQILGTVCYLVLTGLGGLFVPLTEVPGWVAAIGRSSPTYRYSQVAADAALGTAPQWSAIAVLLGWTVVGAGLAALAYRGTGRKL